MLLCLGMTIRVLNAPLQGNHQGARNLPGDGGSTWVTNQKGEPVCLLLRLLVTTNSDTLLKSCTNMVVAAPCHCHHGVAAFVLPSQMRVQGRLPLTLASSIDIISDVLDSEDSSLVSLASS